MSITWIDFTIGTNAISINDILKARGELVGLVESGRGLLSLHPVEDGGNGGAASLLEDHKQEVRGRFQFTVTHFIFSPANRIFPIL